MYDIVYLLIGDSDVSLIYQQGVPAHLAAILGAVGGTLVVIVIATIGAMVVLMKTILIRRIPQHQDTLSNKKGIYHYGSLLFTSLHEKIKQNFATVQYH